MRGPIADFDAVRRVYRAESRALFDVPLMAGAAADVRAYYVRDDWRKDDLTATSLDRGEASFWQELEVNVQDSRLRFSVMFRGEHQHAVRLTAGEAVQNESFYSLGDDLAGFRAFKGNLHCHSTVTGGTMTPGQCAAAMRQAGFDFCALTDHEQFEPSVQAMAAMAPFDCGLICYNGEETSTQPGSPYSSCGSGVNHLLSIGADRWVMQPLMASPESYGAQAAAIAAEEPYASLPEPERGLAARVELTCRAIHEAGGVAIYCHPFWMTGGRFYAPPAETEFLLRHGTFDALEIGNFVHQRTATMNAMVLELALQGVKPPAFVGTSDWHGPERWLPDHSYTIFLARDASLESFREAIKARRTVAVSGKLEDFALGSYRLVKYAYFLMTHYFSLVHDPLCRRQGELILKSMDDGVDRQPEISGLKRQLAAVAERFF